MAMLAEPRRKQKISLNPQGKLFMEDKDNKGRALLEKMGWKAGEGLGKDNQGLSAPIKLKIQTSTKGLGSDSKEDPWVGHNKSFAKILGDLNTHSNSDAEPQPQGSNTRALESMECKSKASKTRIHYKKFVQNKDLSRASAKDLACIFGKPTEFGDADFLPPSIEQSIPETGSKTMISINTDSPSECTTYIGELRKKKKKRIKLSVEMEIKNDETNPISLEEKDLDSVDVILETHKKKKKRKKRD